MKLIFFLFLLFQVNLGRLCASTVDNRFALAYLVPTGVISSAEKFFIQNSSQELLKFIENTTTIDIIEEIQLVTLDAPEIFSHPFIIFDASMMIKWDDFKKRQLKMYLSNGGFLLIKNQFIEHDSSIKSVITSLFQDKSFSQIDDDHTIYRSFYLFRSQDIREHSIHLRALSIDNRLAVVIGSQELLGVWMKDAIGQPLIKDYPRRWQFQKMMVNIVLYALTIDYKTDAVHTPYILRKLNEK